MLTEEEFEKRWRRIGKKGRKFIITYCENGLDYHDAALKAGFQGVCLSHPCRMLRKYNDLINYLLKKNNIIDTIIKPQWVLQEYSKLYQNTNSEITKINILNQLSKILSLINTQPQVNVENNLPSTPVIIKFDKDE